eukprot:gb/GECG01003755.1/.p1 GENE.gb/GECG01003755.1/~~gb/GECG01003755.1/.p1  ORF type:complete len:514 (+),score=54.85 gb/GECG01003755.1/:1-1542(+)
MEGRKGQIMDWATRLEIKYERTAPPLEKKDESLFYHVLKQHHQDLLYNCAYHKWTLCIPVTSALPSDRISRAEIETHILKYIKPNHLESLTGAAIRSSDDALWLQPESALPINQSQAVIDPEELDAQEVHDASSTRSSFTLNSEPGDSTERASSDVSALLADSDKGAHGQLILSHRKIKVIPGRIPLLQRYTHKVKMKDGRTSSFPVIHIGRAFHGKIYAASVGEELTESGIRLYMGTLACSPETQPVFLTLKNWSDELCKHLRYHNVWDLFTPLALLIERQCYNAVRCLLESGIVQEMTGRQQSILQKIFTLCRRETNQWRPSIESIREQLVRVCGSYIFERLHDELMRQVTEAFHSEISSFNKKLEKMAQSVTQDSIGVDKHVKGEFFSVSLALSKVHRAKTPLSKLQCFNEARQRLSECCYYNAMKNGCDMDTFAVGSDHMINPLVFVLVKHHKEIRSSLLLAQLIFIADFHKFAERTLEKAFMDIQAAILYLLEKVNKVSDESKGKTDG